MALHYTALSIDDCPDMSIFDRFPTFDTIVRTMTSPCYFYIVQYTCTTTYENNAANSKFCIAAQTGPKVLGKSYMCCHLLFFYLSHKSIILAPISLGKVFIQGIHFGFENA